MITKNTIINEIVITHPKAAIVLLEAGIHCIGCGANVIETVEQGLKSHGMNDKQIEELIKKMNEANQ